MERDRERIAGRGGYVPLYRQAALPPDEEAKPRIERLAVVDTVLMYRGERGLPGLYISGVPIADDKSYFEIEITSADLEGGGGGPVIGKGQYSTRGCLDSLSVLFTIFRALCIQKSGNFIGISSKF